MLFAGSDEQDISRTEGNFLSFPLESVRYRWR